MAEPYTRTFRARWSETNAIGYVKLAAYLQYLTETAWDWGAAGGLGIAENEALGLAWIIRETDLTLNRPLAANDIFNFTIWLAKWRRFRGTRYFEIRLKDGDDVVANGAQEVAVLDRKTLRPVRVPQHLMDGFIMQNPRTIQRRPCPNFEPQPDTAFVISRDVEWRDLDSLEHVNNAAYASFAENAWFRHWLL